MGCSNLDDNSVVAVSSRTGGASLSTHDDDRRGEQGIAGPRGEQGSQGPSGAQGSEGPPGSASQRGATGRTGERGRQGRRAPVNWAPLIGYLFLVVMVAVFFAIKIQTDYETCQERNRTELLARQTFRKMAAVEENEKLAQVFRERADGVGSLPECTRLGR